MNTKQQLQDKSKKTKHIISGIALLLMFLFVICLLLWRLLLYVPSDYQPAQSAGSEQVSPYLTHKLAPDFYNNIQLDKPFYFLVEQQGLNDIITRSENWPVDVDFAAIDTPTAVFTPGQIQVMAKINFGKFPMVTTVTLTPILNEAGLLVLNFQHVKAGAINITPMAKNLIVNLIDSEISAYDSPDYNTWLTNIKNAVTDNTPFDPVFPVDSETLIRISEIEITDAQSKFLLTPITKE